MYAQLNRELAQHTHLCMCSMWRFCFFLFGLTLISHGRGSSSLELITELCFFLFFFAFAMTLQFVTNRPSTKRLVCRKSVGPCPVERQRVSFCCARGANAHITAPNNAKNLIGSSTKQIVTSVCGFWKLLAIPRN
jgi:hypothetical protein